MSDSEPHNEDTADDAGVDLSSLQDLSFGPTWTDSLNVRKGGGGGEGRRGSSGQGRKDKPSAAKDRRKGGKPERRGPRHQGGKPRDEYVPVMDVQLYPEDGAFDALSKSIRKSCRTYELFEIARVILEKPDRHVAVVRNMADKEGKHADLSVCVLDGMPFRRDDDVIAHVLRKHIGEFFELIETETEPPKGNFTFVQKCPVTGDLIGAPNYHRFPSLLKDHHASKVSHIPFERYQNKLEKVTDEESIQAWVESMSKVVRYKLKGSEEEIILDNLDSVRHHLLVNEKEKVLKHQNSARVSGTDVASVGDKEVQRSINAVIERQQKFPLDTANNLRSRFRRLKFNVYKKGSKGVSYVCAVRRKFRDPSTRFSDSIQKLIEFIEGHPQIQIKELPKAFLGIELPSVVEGEEAPAVDAAEDESLKQLMQDFNWLLAEGYLTEYGDGKLYVPPPMKQLQEQSKGVGAAPKVEELPKEEEVVKPETTPEVLENAASIEAAEDATSEDSPAPSA